MITEGIATPIAILSFVSNVDEALLGDCDVDAEKSADVAEGPIVAGVTEVVNAGMSLKGLISVGSRKLTVGLSPFSQIVRPITSRNREPRSDEKLIEAVVAGLKNGMGCTLKGPTVRFMHIVLAECADVTMYRVTIT